MITNIIAAAKRIEATKPEALTLYDAEVALSIYNDEGKLVWSTEQRTVSQGHTTRDLARAAAIGWIRDNLGPVIAKLPKAKP